MLTYFFFFFEEYIHNPFLIDSLKFDLRIYVLITSIKPLEIHICDEGMVRFATVNYQKPNENNLDQIYMHLTNYSLNKRNESYKYPKKTNEIDHEEEDDDSAGQGSKRKLTKVFNYMSKMGLNVNKIKAKIDDLVIKTILALLPNIKIESAFESYSNPNKPKFFQILGFDILLKEDLNPVLLEVNCNPSLTVDYETSIDGINK
jgi:hypothetical protein